MPTSSAVNRIECYIEDLSDNLEAIITKTFCYLVLGLMGTIVMLGLFLKRINDSIINLQASRQGIGGANALKQNQQINCGKPDCSGCSKPDSSLTVSGTQQKKDEKVGSSTENKQQATSYHEAEKCKPLTILNTTNNIGKTTNKESNDNKINEQNEADNKDDASKPSVPSSSSGSSILRSVSNILKICPSKAKCATNYKKKMGRPPDLSTLPTVADLQKHHNLSKAKPCSSCIRLQKSNCSACCDDKR